MFAVSLKFIYVIFFACSHTAIIIIIIIIIIIKAICSAQDYSKATNALSSGIVNCSNINCLRISVEQKCLQLCSKSLKRKHRLIAIAFLKKYLV